MDGVRVPVDLLLDPGMTASAKVVWMALHLYPELTKEHRPSPTRLAALTGLSRPTVRKGLARLAAAGWYQFAPERQGSPHGGPTASLRSQNPVPEDLGSPLASQALLPSKPRSSSATAADRSVNPDRASFQDRISSQDGPHAIPLQPSQRFATIPRELLEDRTAKPQAVVMYGVLQATPGFRQPKGKFTCKQLRGLTGRAVKTVRRATNLLVNRGWLEVTRRNRLHPFAFVVRNPIHEECKAELARVKKRIRKAEFKGEGLMREYLTLIVDSDEFEDDASPGFLVNPFTDERMGLDRYYPNRVAFEFNGLQHYEVTEFSTAQEVEKQRARDRIKAGICEDRKIRFVVVHAEDLTLKTMIDRIGTSLPLRDLRNSRPIIRYLEKTSWRYRQAALRGKALASRKTAGT